MSLVVIVKGRGGHYRGEQLKLMEENLRVFYNVVTWESSNTSEHIALESLQEWAINRNSHSHYTSRTYPSTRPGNMILINRRFDTYHDIHIRFVLFGLKQNPSSSPGTCWGWSWSLGGEFVLPENGLWGQGTDGPGPLGIGQQCSDADQSHQSATDCVPPRLSLYVLSK